MGQTRSRLIISPARVLLASFILVITVGTMLLSLPQAREVDISFFDLLFTVTSTTCVTGLNVIPLSHFTFFGKCVLLALIQIGGLGLMTLSFFLVSLFLNLGMATRMIAGQLLEFEFWGKIRHFLLLIIGLTVAVEGIGALLLYGAFRKILNPSDAAFYALFHSVSSFCNAGISLFEKGHFNFSDHPFVLITCSFLAIFGGIGFVVWYDLLLYTRKFFYYIRGIAHRFSISLHSKLVLSTTSMLLLAGTLFIWCIERSHTLQTHSFFHQIISSFFISASSRCAGFAIVNLAQASQATLLILLILMVIGASPSSTGAGIKTSTFALFFASTVAIIRNRESVELFGRTISPDQIYKATAIIAIAGSWIAVTTFILLLCEKDFSFMDLLFEAVSAFGTVGYSLGITPQLSYISKCVLMVSMITGRIGSLTLVLALRKKRERLLYQYPEERVIIG